MIDEATAVAAWLMAGVLAGCGEIGCRTLFDFLAVCAFAAGAVLIWEEET